MRIGFSDENRILFFNDTKEIKKLKKFDFWFNFEDPTDPKIEYDIQDRRTPKQLKKRKERASKNKRQMNIVYILIDALSRREFFRDLPKTTAYLEKYFGHSLTQDADSQNEIKL